ncbi:ABC transporter permease [Sporosarcina sp. ANT_H38]|uniref:ABC transporter permease n=1 Tax=Sporosarcina sp. ANT_H38 TaxID=2597358 RepID=UPI0011F2A62C|nr:ABC transporter permease [Sporosarcina sp. ANT_H38]KAA0948726.1 ABC transporter permease [Sporosarcina sp. ANT_H38]
MTTVKKWFQSYALFIIASIIMMLGIEWIVHQKIVPAYILPAPSSVVVAISRNWRPLIQEHLSMTMLEFAIGFTISVIGGISLAVSMFFSKIIEKLMYPAVLISQTIPIIALSPIFVLWFGYTIWSKVAVTVLISFFPVVVGTFDGLRSTDKEYVDLLRSMGATKRHLFQKLYFPSALPSFFSGLKIAIVSALIGATIGEWLGASEGLGYYSRRMSGNLNAEGVFSAITLLSIAGMMLFGFVSILEKRFLSWKND